MSVESNTWFWVRPWLKAILRILGYSAIVFSVALILVLVIIKFLESLS
jgi:hypothetical protein